MPHAKNIFWFRQDLRLSDNPGLCEAIQNGSTIPVYVWDNHAIEGGASRWWLHHSLHSLNASLKGQLNVYKGPTLDILRDVAQRHQTSHIFWNRCYEPHRIQQDTAIKQTLKNEGFNVKSSQASLLWEPWDITKKDGTPYKVYTPYYRQGCLQAKPPRHSIDAPSHADFVKDSASLPIDALNLLDTFPWHEKLQPHWHIGEQAAHNACDDFIQNALKGYAEGRDYPHRNQTSHLSPHLHFGEISPNQVWYKILNHVAAHGNSLDSDRFLSELAWREFSHYILYHFPQLPHSNFQSKFDCFPWQNNPRHLEAWQKGQTGYPIVDAGMRELWQTGYMHNRVRMIVASFLVKNLRIHWREGAAWFWDCLVDANLANNSASWQWVAGSGTDAAPYFRIFNPITQGEKFDPEGYYTRHYVPELANMPQKFLFQPWEAPSHTLKQAGVMLGQTYPHPIVNLQQSRSQALEAYKRL